MDWLENSNSSVTLDGEKLAQLIGNRQKLETAAISKIFSRQIPQYFSASKVHNRTVPSCLFLILPTQTVGNVGSDGN